ncbi:ead/Ea22-like family protein [Klebsiella quasipneumoniae]|uniref:ead/Ea22-like family protein n=1 Tax=Klebsiella quasipneumoniae TaxID=1463165 RepID=UPI0022E2BCD2|nr:ead/Ea22-like family protein [Klebsiella quasipneumoniae]
MTDITELAQSLKNAASKALIEEGLTWFSEEQLSNEDGIALHKADAEFIALANPANVLALVDALEKAQAKADVYDMLRDDYGLREKGVGLADFVDWQAKRIAELDSRAVNVENLQESAYRAGLTAGWNLGLANNNDGFNKCLAAHTAGIKVEAD